MYLNLALENINYWAWNNCCSEAITTGIKMGISTVETKEVLK
jgi:hypothetical protein